MIATELVVSLWRIFICMIPMPVLSSHCVVGLHGLLFLFFQVDSTRRSSALTYIFSQSNSSLRKLISLTTAVRDDHLHVDDIDRRHSLLTSCIGAVDWYVTY